MIVSVDLPPELERAVCQHAARAGQDVSAFVLNAVAEMIAKTRTIEEICAPFAQAVAATGVSDDEFDEFFQGVRQEVWKAKQASAQVSRPSCVH